MPFKDPEKRREYRRRWYKVNSTSEKNHVTKRKKLIRKWLEDYKKEITCSKCSESHPATLDFHHKNNKELEIGFMVANGYSIDRIKKELEKCEVLCANCHRKFHYLNNKI